jgi:Na+-exporting ATPase
MTNKPNRIYDVRRNKFLFWAIIFGFITIFPTLYIPVINRVVFKHEMITWEWAVVVVATILFFAGIEAWKFAKRVFFRRSAAANGGSQVPSLGWDRQDTNESSDAEKGEVTDREGQ